MPIRDRRPYAKPTSGGHHVRTSASVRRRAGTRAHGRARRVRSSRARVEPALQRHRRVRRCWRAAPGRSGTRSSWRRRAVGVRALRGRVTGGRPRIRTGPSGPGSALTDPGGLLVTRRAMCSIRGVMVVMILPRLLPSPRSGRRLGVSCRCSLPRGRPAGVRLRQLRARLRRGSVPQPHHRCRHDRRDRHRQRDDQRHRRRPGRQRPGPGPRICRQGPRRQATRS